MPRAEQIRADVLATAQQIAGGFFLVGRDVNRGQRAGAIQDRELRRIAAVRLDPIARAARNQGRRNDVARNARARSGPAAAQSRTGPPRNNSAPRPAAASRSTKRRIVGLSDDSECSAGVRWLGSKTAATVVAAC